MLSAHSTHLLHSEYLQPLVPAATSIELDAKKSPLALLAQTCSQIGKTEPPHSSKLTSMSSGSLAEKEAASRPTSSSLKHGEQRPPLEDKSSFTPYSKMAPADGGVTGGDRGDKIGFRAPHNGTGGAPFTPHPTPSTPSQILTPTSPLHSHIHSHSHTHTQQGRTQSPSTPKSMHTHTAANGQATLPPDSTYFENGRSGKKEAELNSKGNMDDAQLANSAHGRASANSSSSGSSDCSPRHEGKVDPHPSHLARGSGYLTPISPFKPGHPLFPLPPSAALGYHGSIVGAYASYPPQYTPGLDPSKSGGGGGVVGGKHSSPSPLTGASPPAFMQALCRDPYCLGYPNNCAPHLGGTPNCPPALHDPSSSPAAAAALKAAFPLIYPPHPLHALHGGSALSTGISPASLSHPLYSAYGFLLPSEAASAPHACNWVSAGMGPCDKRFATSEELLVHLRTHTTSLPTSTLDGARLLSTYPSTVPTSSSSTTATTCHLHLPQTSSAPMPSPFSLRAPPTLGLARYHPYGKVSLPAHAPQSLPAGVPYYPHYALYGQRL